MAKAPGKPRQRPPVPSCKSLVDPSNYKVRVSYRQSGRNAAEVDETPARTRVRQLPRQVAAAHQEAVDGVRGLAALADRPHHEALAAADVAGGKHLLPRLDAVVALAGIEALEAPARHDCKAQLLDEVILHRPGKTHGEQ